LPNKSKLGLYFNPFGSINSLVDDCVDAAIEKIVNSQFGSYADVRNEQSFAALCEHARANINDEVFAIAILVEQGLVIAASIQKQLKGKVELNMVSALADIKEHLENLVFVGFVSAVTATRLVDWKRYLQALDKRIEKLKIDPSRDRLHSIAIQQVVGRYTQKCDEYKLKRGVPKELLETRWMIEELRVSFFAQQLGTRYPISAKRIENHLADF
jgi:ATP-dependent helicase HrpA